MGTLIRDLRYAARMLRRSPGFTTVAVLTLTLAIGANLAIFTVVNAVLVRPLPFRQPGQLVRIFADVPGIGAKDVGTSVPEMNDIRTSGIFDGASAIWAIPAALTGGDTPQRVEGQAVSFDYFPLLGAHAEMGRTIGYSDAQSSFALLAVISDAFWKRNFGADPNILGRKIRLDTDPYTIVGVMPPDFRHPGPTLQGDVDVWIAAGFVGDPFPAVATRNQNFLPGTIARLKPGMTPAQAQARLDALSARLRLTHPTDYRPNGMWSLRLEPLQENLTGSVRQPLFLLQVAVLFVLLIACVNIAGLLLARASGRVREVAIRQAMGAPRRRLIQQLLTESVLLSLGGTTLALLLLSLFRAQLVAAVPANLPRLSEIHLDLHTLAFSVLLAVGTGLLFGMAPALQVSAANPNSAMQEGGRTATSGAQNRLRSGLVTVEVALSLMLLIGAGLLIRSFRGTLEETPGINTDQLTIAQIWIPVPNNPAQNPYLQANQRNAFIQAVTRNANAIPGVQAAAMAGGGAGLPFVTATRGKTAFTFAGEPPPAAGSLLAESATAGAGYFRVLQVPLMQGRYFTDADITGHQQVAIVNQAFVKRFSPNRDVTQRQLIFNPKLPPLPIVGVVGDIRDEGLDAPVNPRFYLSLLQFSPFNLAVYLRSALPVATLGPQIAQAVHAVDSTLPVYSVQPITGLIAESLARRRFLLSLMSAFAGLALLLAALGIYGVMAYAVTRRTREIGIRVALGADGRDIQGLILKPGLWLTVSGVAAGVLGALALTRLMRSVLYNVSPTDAITYVEVSLLLTAVASAACWLPARRASKMKPVDALQTE